MAKKLYRSRRQRMLGGVCGGLAEYFNVDVTVIRLVWALTFFAGGGGLLVYFIAWIVIPEAPGYEEKPSAEETAEAAVTEDNRREMGDDRKGDSGSKIIGLILIFLGIYLTADRFIPRFLIRTYWPVALIVLGVFFLVRGLRNRE